ncbi:Major facilitator superfamily domain, general substrate transporter [Metarhizium album ARSEF 1941]|uniref:Major facilitator superfamily domain, general substrate transporter n=1 Tax=Metarhizium album (strain ARSEF 1941) TaxID=1081103 RepID=A0A0B2WY22_METAS|nr:Major facilitator superfamily domain, general substrate transporter [Metarhizium album ARSEF 1941]KHN98953.1 Major facilitator superfamily domain, general substrate transporter [Metarhizium album ARSEF 1941]
MSELTAAEKGLHDQANLLPRQKLIPVLCVLAVPSLISFIDQNGISTALPTIAADLNAKDTIAWAGIASLIANTTFTMLYGRLSDIFGRKNVYVAAVAMLAFADLMCGLSQNVTTFYIFRGVAGIGGGGIVNLSMIIVSDVVTLEERGKYQGIISSMVGLGSATGPFIAAAFVSKSTWRGFFYLLAPLGALSGLVAVVFLPSKPPTAGFKESMKKVDWLGLFTSSVAVIFLLIPISGGGAYFPWSSPLVISFLAIGTIALVAFVVIEWKVAALPMMPISMFRNPVIVVILAQTFILGLVYQSYVYFVPLYLQNARQFSVIESALTFSPTVGIQSLAGILAGYWIARYKRYGIVIKCGFGLWLLGAGLTLMYNRQTSPWVIAVPLFILGVGVGLVLQPTLIALQAHSPKSRRAVIISNRNFNRCAGGAVGLAVSAAIMQAVLRRALPREYASLSSSTFDVPDVAGGFPPGVLDAYMSASYAVFAMQVPLVGICFLGTFFIKDKGLAFADEPGASEDKDKGASENDLEAGPPSSRSSVMERAASTVAGTGQDAEKPCEPSVKVAGPDEDTADGKASTKA